MEGGNSTRIYYQIINCPPPVVTGFTHSKGQFCVTCPIRIIEWHSNNFILIVVMVVSELGSDTHVNISTGSAPS